MLFITCYVLLIYNTSPNNSFRSYKSTSFNQSISNFIFTNYLQDKIVFPWEKVVLLEESLWGFLLMFFDINFRSYPTFFLTKKPFNLVKLCEMLARWDRIGPKINSKWEPPSILAPEPKDNDRHSHFDLLQKLKLLC